MPYWLESLVRNGYVGGAAIGAVVVLVLWWICSRQPRVFKAFDTAGGQVRVTRKAVRELVRRCAEGVDHVKSARVEVAVRRGALFVDVKLRVERAVNLKAVSGYLREQITQVLTDNLGVDGIGDIAITVVGIVEDPAGEAVDA
ncbi:hypothetical protein ASA1KI_04550 [Opitutales bacterium ASA1]|uniref:hypothetical protein n=1 Tax=Congregicoccus parvus TaxID=3081749 RepID=UPI002B2BCAC0|nr:hypothetical protein ASA1KI_04550 [Opitutales bacterium ASA1]